MHGVLKTILTALGVAVPASSVFAFFLDIFHRRPTLSVVLCPMCPMGNSGKPDYERSTLAINVVNTGFVAVSVSEVGLFDGDGNTQFVQLECESDHAGFPHFLEPGCSLQFKIHHTTFVRPGVERIRAGFAKTVAGKVFCSEWFSDIRKLRGESGVLAKRMHRRITRALGWRRFQFRFSLGFHL